MYLLYNGQRIAKKKTHVKKRTLNPVFNESFVFEVPAAPNASLDHVSLELLVLDWDRVTKNEVRDCSQKVFFIIYVEGLYQSPFLKNTARRSRIMRSVSYQMTDVTTK